MVRHPLVPQDGINPYTYLEARTQGGQLLSIRCSTEKEHQDKIKEALNFVRDIDIPTSHRTNVSHGGYGRYTRYDIEQLKYAGGHGGYVETLHIRDAPDGRCPFVFNKSGGRQDCFIEWKTRDDLVACWDFFWNNCGEGFVEKLAKQPGYMRTVPCEGLEPWFYANGDESLMGDFVFPSVFGEHPVYRPMKKFIVRDSCTGLPTIKTCMGAAVWMQESYDGHKKYERTVVYWDDGTRYDSYLGTSSIAPLRDDQLWISEAIEQFKQLLSGKNTVFEVPFADGSKFRGHLILSDESSKNLPGAYNVQLTVERDGKQKTINGTVQFKPTSDCPNILSRIEHDATAKQVKLVSIDACTRQRHNFKGPWRGVYNLNRSKYGSDKSHSHEDELPNRDCDVGPW